MSQWNTFSRSSGSTDDTENLMFCLLGTVTSCTQSFIAKSLMIVFLTSSVAVAVNDMKGVALFKIDLISAKRA